MNDTPNYINAYQFVNNFDKLANIETELISEKPDALPEPLISIIITVYKRQRCLHEAIDSAINQKDVTFPYEIIVLSDDPDSCFEKLHEYANMPNIYFYRNRKNLGLYNNCNLGVLTARGKYVAFLHDDDILYPEYLKNIYKFITRTKPDAKCVIVHQDTLGIPQNRQKSYIHIIFKIFLWVFFLLKRIMRKEYKKISLKDGLTYLLSNIYYAPSCGTLFEKQAFVTKGGFNQDFWPISDYLFFINFNSYFDIFILRTKLAAYRWIDNLSQQKDIQFLSLKLLNLFFKSKQPIKSVNRYYSFFKNEIFYAKYLMVNKNYRDEINNLYPEIQKQNRHKWQIFVLYNRLYKFLHNLV